MGALCVRVRARVVRRGTEPKQELCNALHVLTYGPTPTQQQACLLVVARASTLAQTNGKFPLSRQISFCCGLVVSMLCWDLFA